MSKKTGDFSIPRMTRRGALSGFALGGAGLLGEATGRSHSEVRRMP